MELGMIGLGSMGGNMAQRLLRAGHIVVAYDPRTEAVDGVLDALAGLCDVVIPADRDGLEGLHLSDDRRSGLDEHFRQTTVRDHQ